MEIEAGEDGAGEEEGREAELFFLEEEAVKGRPAEEGEEGDRSGEGTGWWLRVDEEEVGGGGFDELLLGPTLILRLVGIPLAVEAAVPGTCFLASFPFGLAVVVSGMVLCAVVCRSFFSTIF